MILAEALAEISGDEQWQNSLEDWQRRHLLTFATNYLAECAARGWDVDAACRSVQQMLRAVAEIETVTYKLPNAQEWARYV